MATAAHTESADRLLRKKFIRISLAHFASALPARKFWRDMVVVCGEALDVEGNEIPEAV
jgi:hypothetical protein